MIETSTILEATETAPSLVASQLSRLIFVGGCPRSGTTLVQRVLNCHPEIYGGPEFDFVPLIANLSEGMRRSIQSGRIDAVLDENSLTHAFRGLLVALLSPKLQSEGVSFLSEKTPSNVLAFAWLEQCAPEAKKIFVIRDPRDVVSSMLEVGRRQRSRRHAASGFVRDTVAAVDYMNGCLKAGAELADASSNCLVVYYEDLVSDPLTVANQMYGFVGLQELERLDLERQEFESPRDRESWIDWSPPEIARDGAEKARVGRGQRTLKNSDLEYISAKTFRHPVLTERYSIPSSRLTISARCCVASCMLSRIRENLPELWTSLRRKLTQ